MKKVLTSLTALAVIVTAMGIGTANAAVIFTEDFESPRTDNTNPLPMPDGWDWTRARTDIIGLFDQESSGDQQFYGYNGGGGWTLTTTDTILSDTVTTGVEYTLSGLWWGKTSSRPVALTAKLLAIDGSGNETVLATDTWLSDGNVGTEWDSKAEAQTFTLSVTPTTNAGERLAIYLDSGGGGTKHTMIDDVTLVTSAGDVPGTLIYVK